ncbi:hypothetical protein IEQ34_013247 [Dendrobium chrysotoxum]|uniref:LOB domain-containing protein n=1 Tax=Dendrobium chrysotoxum TaxID=161865 RepID=A0AAV7GNR1_DENCH|nr:hypothetical protein IEQ34_013247 [Dendrobium chrysotoxum]
MDRVSFNPNGLCDRSRWIDHTMFPSAKKKKAKPTPATAAGNSSSSVTAPCGACKFLRRKCVSGCVFAAHFGSEQGAPARFAAVHKVFGASNVSKLLKLVPPAHRHDAVVTVCYEAQARICDPVLGCVATILALHHQVSLSLSLIIHSKKFSISQILNSKRNKQKFSFRSVPSYLICFSTIKQTVVQLQSELSIVQSQLINSKLAAAEAFQYSQTQQQLMTVQPAYSNSSVSNNLNFSNFPSSGLDFCDSQSLELLQLSQTIQDDGEEVEDSTDKYP